MRRQQSRAEEPALVLAVGLLVGVLEATALPFPGYERGLRHAVEADSPGRREMVFS